MTRRPRTPGRRRRRSASRRRRSSGPRTLVELGRSSGLIPAMRGRLIVAELRVEKVLRAGLVPSYPRAQIPTPRSPSRLTRSYFAPSAAASSKYSSRHEVTQPYVEVQFPAGRRSRRPARSCRSDARTGRGGRPRCRTRRSSSSRTSARSGSRRAGHRTRSTRRDRSTAPEDDLARRDAVEVGIEGVGDVVGRPAEGSDRTGRRCTRPAVVVAHDQDGIGRAGSRGVLDRIVADPAGRVECQLIALGELVELGTGGSGRRP